MAMRRRRWPAARAIARPVGVEPHDAVPAPRRRTPAALEQRRWRHQHRRAGVRQHERQPLRRVVGVERQIGAAGLEDAEQPDQHLQRALDAKPDHRLGPDPEPAQVMRQLVGVRIERARSSAARSSNTTATASGVRAPAPQTAPAALGRAAAPARSRSSPAGCASRSAAAQHLQPPDRAHPASATAASSSRTSRPPDAATLGAIEQVGGVFQRAGDARRRAVGAALLAQAQRQVELRARGRHRLEPRRKPGQLQPRPPRCSGTPASPGTADAATASAPG